MITGMCRVASSAAQPPEQLEAVDPRHHHVGQHDVGRALGNRGQRLLAVRRRPHRPLPPEQPGQVRAHVGVVVDDEDVGARASRRRARPGREVSSSQLAASPRAASDGAMFPLSPDDVRRTERQRDGERAARARLALHRDGAAVQGGQLVHQRQADAGALARAGGRPRHPVEALEQVRQLVGDDPDAGVGHAQHEPRRRRRAARRRCPPTNVYFTALASRLTTTFSHIRGST